MYAVEWDEPANADVDAIHDYLAITKKNPALAARVRDGLRAAPELLADFPKSAPIVAGNIRQLVRTIGNYAYLIRYLVIEVDQVVLITRVLGGSQER